MKALLSVYDKTGIEELARGLSSLGWELISSGGTSAALTAAAPSSSSRLLHRAGSRSISAAQSAHSLTSVAKNS